MTVAPKRQTAVNERAKINGGPPTDLAGLLDEATGQRYAFIKGRFLLKNPRPEHPPLPCADLADRDRLMQAIAPFADSFPSGTDQRAVLSFWSQIYLSTLVIATTLFWLELRLVLPVGLERLSVLLDPQTARPEGFLLQNAGQFTPQVEIEEAFEGLLHGHLDRLIPAMSKACGLSQRLLWNNAASYLDWIVDEIGGSDRPQLTAQGRRLLDPPLRPDGSKNPLYGLVQHRIDAQTGAMQKQRRVCCLRYALPGIGGCGALCPLKHGQSSE
ncbi:siderophore-iron reductase FhuF [Allorhizobium sp. BGMRC 0089]|uniref:siderophore-iron reductase FhuF n=1 Tax=Allorhizobium sonneratiae TaxID=2934936 RepID=UPI00203493C3|nr:siderophore-iron reductase FhuF [Allorhizobium sonneratiae]